MNSIGRLIITEASCDDSMAWARRMLPTVDDGTVLIARDLVAARGRQGRTWVLADGQITHTVILKPKNFIPTEQALATLNMALALGLYEVLQRFGVVLKWPNDFYLNEKKLGGMLFENLWQGEQLVGIVLGYSLNVNNKCVDHEVLASIATSLVDVTGKVQDLGKMQQEVFASLSRLYDQWQRGEFQGIFQQWRHHQFYLGKQVSVHNKDGSRLDGLAQDVLPNGDLVLYSATADSTMPVTFAQVEDIKLTT